MYIMKEDFIVYLWKYGVLRSRSLKTVCGERLEILSPGHENPDSGPDFLAASVRIGDTVWVGNVEIHVRSSQWFAHKHHIDKAYANIILHLVYIYDKEVLDKNGKPIHHLEARGNFDPGLQYNYSQLINNRNWIPCEKLLYNQDAFILNHWLWRLAISRLERKAQDFNHFLEYFSHHKEKTLLYMLARSLGGKINATAFGMLIQRISYEVLLRNCDRVLTLEALLLGQAGMLERDFQESYPIELQQEYRFLKKKYELSQPLNYELWKYSKMRPGNFPDLRIVQLGMMLHKSRGQLFRKIILSNDQSSATELLSVTPSPYWHTHYRLDKPIAKKNRAIGAGTIQNIQINTIAPLLLLIAKGSFGTKSTEPALEILEKLPPENNKIIRKWLKILPVEAHPNNAALTQGLLELQKFYCLPKKCLRCMIGHKVLGEKQTSSTQSMVPSS